MNIKSNVQIDCKGLSCPMPIIKTKKALEKMNQGEVAEIIATDKGSISDLQAWSKTTNNLYIGNLVKDGVIRHFIAKKENLSTEEIKFKNIINNSNLVNVLDDNSIILDVREPAEFAFGHIKNAKNIALGDVESAIETLDKNLNIYVICRSGVRSDMVCNTLDKAGFNKVWNVVPGMSQWEYEDIIEKEN